ncbi:MAG: DUF4249 domain-containing protein [Bacteroidia bacterium]|nr:DUF4249 domain-containing protein [Bacteroidia bacterium]
MKRLNRLPALIILSLLLILTSCEEVIKLDLKNSAPRMVIDATLDASAGKCLVRLSRSLDFYQTDTAVSLMGATVDLISGSGGITELAEISPGVYSASNIAVASEEVFRIEVMVTADERYTAWSKTPESVKLDSLKVVTGISDPGPTSPPIFLVKPKWKDPAGVANYYRFKVTTKGKPQTGFTITNDEPFDGTEVDMQLSDFEFAFGDTVRFEFVSIDSVSYSYFSQVNDMALPGFVSATPYNPIGNFDNGALGYFGIYYSEVWDTIIAAGR